MKKQRIAFLDFARALAILLVVLCHVIELFYPFSLEGMQGLHPRARIFATTALTIGRLGVPLFLMISGYLLLGRRYDEERCRRFWKHNWLHLFFLTIVWILLYQLFFALCCSNPYIPEPEPADGEDPDGEMDGEGTAPVPIPLDMETVTLSLWAIEEE